MQIPFYGLQSSFVLQMHPSLMNAAGELSKPACHADSAMHARQSACFSTLKLGVLREHAAQCQLFSESRALQSAVKKVALQLQSSFTMALCVALHLSISP